MTAGANRAKARGAVDRAQAQAARRPSGRPPQKKVAANQPKVDEIRTSWRKSKRACTARRRTTSSPRRPTTSTRYDFEVAARGGRAERRTAKQQAITEQEKRVSELNLDRREDDRRAQRRSASELGKFTGEVGRRFRSRSTR